MQNNNIDHKKIVERYLGLPKSPSDSVAKIATDHKITRQGVYGILKANGVESMTLVDRQKMRHKTDTTNFGSILRGIRLELNMSQSELAAGCDVRMQTISNLEGNKTQPTYDTLRRLMHGTGKDANAFFDNGPVYNKSSEFRGEMTGKKSVIRSVKSREPGDISLGEDPTSYYDILDCGHRLPVPDSQENRFRKRRACRYCDPVTHCGIFVDTPFCPRCGEKVDYEPVS